MRTLGLKRSAGHYRVLCVEENEIGLFVKATILRTRGYDVVACSDPLRAVKIAQSEEIDVAVMDYQMPLMNGLELGALFRAANPDMRVVILFSGWPVIKSHELAFADLFIRKSEDPHVLVDGIEALLIKGQKRKLGHR